MTHIVETVDYKGYTIRIVYDLDPTNPWEDWETEPPLVACHFNYGRDVIQGYRLDLSMPALPRSVVAKHYRPILSELGGQATWQGLLHFARNEWNPAANTLDQAFCEAYSERLKAKSNGDRMDELATVYGWLGITALSTSATGFSQGDYAELLIVATPKWCERVGIPAERISNALELSRDLYRDWAYGSVYGYQVADADGEEVDSCYGYYGFDHEASGLLQAARKVIDGEAGARASQAAKQAPFRQRAMDGYLSEDIQVYPDACVDIVDDGAWVAAQIWIPNENHGE